MATIKRKKVSGKATQGQKKNGLLHNKLFWIISSIVLVIVIAASITIPVVIFNMSTEEEKIDYIAKKYSYQNQEVSFKKMNYEGVLMHANENDYQDSTYYKHIFFAAFDFTSFYPDSKIDDGKSKDDSSVTFYYNQNHEKALDALVEIQYTIDQYNKDVTEESDKAVLYLIDLSAGNNSKVIQSAKFGGSSDATNEFAFGYIAGVDGFKKEYEYIKDANGNPVSWDLFFNDFSKLRSDSRHVTEFITGTTEHASFQLEL